MEETNELLKAGMMAEKIHDGTDKPKSTWQKVLDFLEYYKLIIWVVLFYAVHVFIWQAFEPQWTLMQCIYFITASLTTVGYGDISPADDHGRLYCIFFLLFGLAAVTSVATGLADRFLYHVEVMCIGHVEVAKVKTKTNLDDEEHLTTNEFYRYRKIVFSIVVVLIAAGIGTIFMCVTHKWTFLQALYWSFVTSLTVGYGDVDFWHDPGTLAFVTVYILTSTLSVAVALGNFVEVSVEIEEENERKRLMDTLDIMDILRDEKYGYGDLQELISVHDKKTKILHSHEYITPNYEVLHHEEHNVDSYKHAITAMTTEDAQGNKHFRNISKLDFMLFMMEKIFGLDRETDIDPLLQKFDELDANKSNDLDLEDIVAFAEAMNAKKAKRRDKENERKNESYYKRVQNFFRSAAQIIPTEGALLSPRGTPSKKDSAKSSPVAGNSPSNSPAPIDPVSKEVEMA